MYKLLPSSWRGALTDADAKGSISCVMRGSCGWFAEGTRGQPTFLNLDKPYPNQIFTIVIWGRERSKFGEPDKKYPDVHLCVTGTITSYRGTPDITASDATQIEIQK